MIPAPFLFLVIALWAKRVHSLECYACNTTKYVGCKSFANCSAAERFCTKFTATTISGFRIMQSCATKCPIAKSIWPPLYTAVCCQMDRCNRASRVSESCTSLLAVATFVVSIRALAILGL